MSITFIPRSPASYGFDEAIVLKNTDNLNDVTNNGIYRWSSSYVPSNAPSSTNCVMFVFGDGSSVVGQIVMPMLGSDGLYIRGKYGSWATQWYHLSVS